LKKPEKRIVWTHIEDIFSKKPPLLLRIDVPQAGNGFYTEKQAF